MAVFLQASANGQNPLIALIVAIIGAAAVIIAAIITNNKKNTSTKGIHFLKPNETFDDLITSVETVYMYAVNSYELSNRVNTLLEQDLSKSINKVIVLVRKKDDESENDKKVLDNIIGIWAKWAKKGRIRELKILSYDYDPDHYYTILGNKLLFTGHVFFDDDKPTGTNVSYSPLVINNDSKLGKEVIEQYTKHFLHLEYRFKDNVICYHSVEQK